MPPNPSAKARGVSARVKRTLGQWLLAGVEKGATMTISATLVHSPASAGATNVANPIRRPLETEAQRSDAQLAQWFSFLSGHTLQTKLQVSSPGDADEREADAAADLVMQGGSPAISISSVPPTLNRKCSACKDDEQKLQRKATDGTA